MSDRRISGRSINSAQEARYYRNKHRNPGANGVHTNKIETAEKLEAEARALAEADDLAYREYCASKGIFGARKSKTATPPAEENVATTSSSKTPT